MAPGEQKIGEFLAHWVKEILKHRNINYRQLAETLNADGFNETEASIANKLTRGTFSAVFFFAAIQASGKDVLQISPSNRGFRVKAGTQYSLRRFDGSRIPRK
jgi:Domain of unknown function (DUF6471)